MSNHTEWRQLQLARDAVERALFRMAECEPANATLRDEIAGYAAQLTAMYERIKILMEER